MCFKHLAVILFTSSALLFAQDSHVSPATGQGEAAFPVIGANLSYEPVNAGDLVYIYVADYPDITRSYRVSANGTISMSLVNDALPVAGLTPTALERKIATSLVAAKLLVRPTVSVVVLEYRSRPVQVSGCVRHPVTIQALGDMRLLDALAKADGLDTDAGFEILVLKPGAGGNQTPYMHIPVQALLDGSQPQLNIPLTGGEQIRVPKAGKLYVVGNVKSPGAFPITEYDGLSVLKAVGLCQGLLPYSQKDAVVYRLNPGGTQRTEIVVPVRAILKHKSADFSLQANDILYISDHPRQRMTANVAERIAGIGSSASSVMLWRAVP
jgi:polysaccharide export outer membrane protein